MIRPIAIMSISAAVMMNGMAAVRPWGTGVLIRRAGRPGYFLAVDLSFAGPILALFLSGSFGRSFPNEPA
jgi:hypothetical protein